MSEEKKVSKCSSCGGKLHKIGTIGLIRYSRCESCGKEHTKKLKQASSDKTVSGSLRECITCNAKYAAAGDPDLCPDCHASFTGRSAANKVVSMSAPVNCDFCGMNGQQVQASYDGRTKLGSWGYMCEKHFAAQGMGLGTGVGSRIVVESIARPIRNMQITRPGEEEKGWELRPWMPFEEMPVGVPESTPVEKPEEAPATTPEPEQVPEQEPTSLPIPETIPEKLPEEEPVAPPAPFPEETPEQEPEEEPSFVPDFVPEEWPGEAPVEPSPVEEPEKVPAGVEDESKLKNKKDKSMITASDNAHPNGELQSLIDQQRQDTSRWQDGENHSPNPNVNPAELHGDATLPEVDRTSETTVANEHFIARVFTSEEGLIEGAKVLLQDGEYQVVGKVTTDAEDGFAVEWRTGRKSIEKKANYELVVVAAEEETGPKNPCSKHPTEEADACPACEALAEEAVQGEEIVTPEGSTPMTLDQVHDSYERAEQARQNAIWRRMDDDRRALPRDDYFG